MEELSAAGESQTAPQNRTSGYDFHRQGSLPTETGWAAQVVQMGGPRKVMNTMLSEFHLNQQVHQGSFQDVLTGFASQAWNFFQEGWVRQAALRQLKKAPNRGTLTW
jgi:hypothetical protein